jgi:hypothetical protein
VLRRSGLFPEPHKENTEQLLNGFLQGEIQLIASDLLQEGCELDTADEKPMKEFGAKFPFVRWDRRFRIACPCGRTFDRVRIDPEVRALGWPN